MRLFGIDFMRALHVLCLLLGSFIGGAFAQTIGGSFVASAISTVVPGMLQSGTGAVWTDVGAANPVIWYLGDRVFTGDGRQMTGARVGTNSTWCGSGTTCASWLPRDAQLLSMAEAGNFGIVGMTRSSDGASLSGGISPMGVGGYALGNSASLSARGGYFETQWETGTYGYGVEVVTKNKGANKTITPYTGPTGSSFGIQLGWGDDSYGGAAANPVTAGIIMTGDGAVHSVNTGISIAAGALQGCSGGAGTCEFAGLPVGAKTNWWSNSTTIAGSIWNEEYQQSTGARFISGTGSPVGAVSCTTRCLYIRTDGGANTTLYVNETGGGTSGWAAK